MLNSTNKRQTGATLVELMISVGIGLMIMSGVVKLFADYVNSNKDVLISTRLNQELRAATDLIARDIRRSGYWQNAINGVWFTGSSGVVSNPYNSLSATSSEITYDYALDTTDTVETNESFGFKLEDATVKMLMGGSWIDVTDPNVTEITALTITPEEYVVGLSEYCINGVAAGNVTPQLTVRNYDISISGRSKTDTTITRQIRESVRVRNDQLTFTPGTNPCGT